MCTLAVAAQISGRSWTQPVHISASRSPARTFKAPKALDMTHIMLLAYDLVRIVAMIAITGTISNKLNWVLRK